MREEYVHAFSFVSNLESELYDIIVDEFSSGPDIYNVSLSTCRGSLSPNLSARVLPVFRARNTLQPFCKSFMENPEIPREWHQKIDILPDTMLKFGRLRLSAGQSRPTSVLIGQLRDLVIQGRIIGSTPNTKSADKWKLLSEAGTLLSSTQPVSSSELSSIVYSLAALDCTDSQVWDHAVDMLAKNSDISPRDLSSVLFSMSKIVSFDVTAISSSKLDHLRTILTKLVTTADWSSRLTLSDTAQILYSSCVLFPMDSRDLIRSLWSSATNQLGQLPRDGEEEIAILTSCREILLLWSSCRVYHPRQINRQFFESLLEASRGLRLCEDFTQHRAGQLAECLTALQCTDPRPVYQIIHYIDTHYSELAQKNILRFVRCFRALRVDNKIAWKRIANRLESPIGLRFSIAELNEIISHMQALKVATRRNLGILQLYIRTKEEHASYGPS